MSETTTLDVVRENADAVARLIDQPLPKGERNNPQAIVKFVLLLWYMVGDIWESFQAEIDQGLEAGRARESAACISLACNSLLALLNRLKATPPPGEVEGLAELLAAVPEAERIQKAARGIVDLLNSPAPPVNEERLARGLAAAQCGDYEDTAAIVERLKAGGEL